MVAVTALGALIVAALGVGGLSGRLALPAGRRTAWSLLWMGGAMGVMATAMAAPGWILFIPSPLPPLLFLSLFGAGLYQATDAGRWARSRRQVAATPQGQRPTEHESSSC